MIRYTFQSPVQIYTSIRHACMIIFWLTDLHEAKKRGNVALRKVENTLNDPKYKLEKQ